MYCEKFYSNATPRLLILLTDESEESVKFVNHIIDWQIQWNFDGDAPRNRCFISVIGYNHNVKELCSGWLKDLDASPFRYETLKRKIHDGAGGFMEVEEKKPVWVEPTNIHIDTGEYSNAIKTIKDVACSWIKDQKLAPIVIDISLECQARNADKEIELLKTTESREGLLLFWGCYRNSKNIDKSFFSKIPEEWIWKLERRGIIREDAIREDAIKGLFNFSNNFSVMSAVMSALY